MKSEISKDEKRKETWCNSSASTREIKVRPTWFIFQTCSTKSCTVTNYLGCAISLIFSDSGACVFLRLGVTRAALTLVGFVLQPFQDPLTPAALRLLRLPNLRSKRAGSRFELFICTCWETRLYWSIHPCLSLVLLLMMLLPWCGPRALTRVNEGPGSVKQPSED